MDWIDVAFSIGIAVSASATVSAYMVNRSTADIKADIRENRVDIRDLKNTFLQYIAKQ